MQSRSWMAALAVVAGCALAGAQADEPSPAVENKVNLQLRIAGLRADACEVEIKPGHPGCQFTTITRRVTRSDAAGTLDLPIVARSIGADRDCSFAITVREPGQPPKTYRRGVRLSPATASQPTPSQTLKVYLNAPSLAARDAPSRPKR